MIKTLKFIFYSKITKTYHILSVNVLNDDEEEESIVLFQSDPLKKPVSYKVGNPTPI